MHRSTVLPRRSLPRRGLLCMLALLAPAVLLAAPPEAIEVRIETGSQQGALRFVPDTLHFERGKYYALTIHNPSPTAHYFTSDGFATRVFTRKVEVLGPGGKTLVEVHGDIRDMEVLPGQTAVWYFYPMTNGKHLKLYCHKEGHEAAGMVGEIEISGPPPFSQ